MHAKLRSNLCRAQYVLIKQRLREEEIFEFLFNYVTTENTNTLEIFQMNKRNNIFHALLSDTMHMKRVIVML